MLLAPLLGLEPAVKLIVLAIPALTVGGLLWVAREVHGRVPPTACFAVPFAYNFPFLFGFVNFALSMALALARLRLVAAAGAAGPLRLRAALFVPISVAALGRPRLRLGDARRARLLGRAGPPARPWPQLRRRGLPRRPPLPVAGPAGRADAALAQRGRRRDRRLVQLGAKCDWLMMALRDRWEWFDLASLALCVGVLLWRAGRAGELTCSRNLAASALFLALVFVLLPQDRVRLGLCRHAARALSVRGRADRDPLHARRRACASRAPSRSPASPSSSSAPAATTASIWLYDRAYDRELAALDHVPRGARMVSFVGRHCVEPWAMTRLLHLPGHGHRSAATPSPTTNGRWPARSCSPSATSRGWPFIRDSIADGARRRCRGEVWRTIDQALATFPRDAFDYVWLISPPPYDPALTARAAAGLARAARACSIGSSIRTRPPPKDD